MFAIRRLAGLVTAVAAMASPAATEGLPVDPGAFREPDLVEIVWLDSTIRLDIRYAGPNNLLGRPVYGEARAFLERPVAEALVRAHRALKARGYGLVVFDGYRPWSVTREFWEATPPERRAYVADPMKGSRHNRGCAVDLTLYEIASGREVDMGGAYDEMTERSHVTYSGGSAESRALRELLREALGREGFFVYPYEWWHFDYKDWRDYPILDLPFSEIRRARPDESRPAAVPDLATARVVDLTHVFDASTLYWPTSPGGFRLERLHFGLTPGGFFYAANAFCAPEHGGTHLDAPIHFAEGRFTVDEIPMRRLVAPAVVIDVTEPVLRDADYRLTTEDIRRWETRNGRIPRGAVVLLRTGWSRHWPNRKAVFGDDTSNDASHLHFPAYGKESAELLVRERSVAALGLDTPSLDHGPSTDFVVHRVAAEANVAGIENLDRLEELPEIGAWIVALPMKIGAGSGGPVRAIALVP